MGKTRTRQRRLSDAYRFAGFRPQATVRGVLLEQLELQLFELEEDQAQEETRLEIAGPVGVTVQPFTRRKPARRPLPNHLPRERVVYPVPSACPCCRAVGAVSTC